MYECMNSLSILNALPLLDIPCVELNKKFGTINLNFDNVSVILLIIFFHKKQHKIPFFYLLLKASLKMEKSKILTSRYNILLH